MTQLEVKILQLKVKLIPLDGDTTATPVARRAASLIPIGGTFVQNSCLKTANLANLSHLVAPLANLPILHLVKVTLASSARCRVAGMTRIGTNSALKILTSKAREIIK